MLKIWDNGDNDDDEENNQLLTGIEQRLLTKLFFLTVDCFGPLHLLTLLRKVGIVIRFLKNGLVISFVLFLFMWPQQ